MSQACHKHHIENNLYLQKPLINDFQVYRNYCNCRNIQKFHANVVHTLVFVKELPDKLFLVRNWVNIPMQGLYISSFMIISLVNLPIHSNGNEVKNGRCTTQDIARCPDIT